MGRIFTKMLGRIGLLIIMIISTHIVARIVFNTLLDTSYLYPRNNPILSWKPDGDMLAATLAHVMGLLLVVAIIYSFKLLGLLLNWIVNGPSTYVDPCQDDECPCARHEVERQNARTASSTAALTTTAAATAAAAAVITTTIIT